MGEPKFTPGPWHAGRSDMLSYDASGTIPFKNIYSDDARGGWHAPTNSPLPLTVAKAVDESALHEESGGKPISTDELFANAWLIAAAPELYDAVQALLPLAIGYAPEGQSDKARVTCQRHIEAARAALAKAEGRDHG